jgi:hypothetical protein
MLTSMTLLHFMDNHPKWFGLELEDYLEQVNNGASKPFRYH